ncbi:hypothetical protein SAMN05216326_12721 [Nitrosomonas marina]|uniref:Uncharacterized protein n=1 Tax=Nitrosomonas marina TaxID=917 RepID=A0A1I0EGA5_9PROT|nr:hypothetical protein [Nitrosomonas marina]SET44161.1 hypothetical protein SAMN05216326_12721 [Nitrosomonas marina]
MKKLAVIFLLAISVSSAEAFAEIDNCPEYPANVTTDWDGKVGAFIKQLKGNGVGANIESSKRSLLSKGNEENYRNQLYLATLCREAKTDPKFKELYREFLASVREEGKPEQSKISFERPTADSQTQIWPTHAPYSEIKENNECDYNNPGTFVCTSAVSRWCRKQGFAGGFAQEFNSNISFYVICVK